jgi:hypothetical protein
MYCTGRINVRTHFVLDLYLGAAIFVDFDYSMMN